MAQFYQWGYLTLTFDISVIDIAMLIAIAVLFAFYVTGFQKETNKQRRNHLTTQTVPRETRKKSISQEIVKQENFNCPHRFGYLKTRKDKNIPDECVGCTKLVKCILPD